MPARLATILDLVRAGLWFIPALMTIAAVLVAWSALAATGLLPERDAVLWTWHPGTGRDGRDTDRGTADGADHHGFARGLGSMVVLTLAA